jgi:hypothetical protein
MAISSFNPVIPRSQESISESPVDVASFKESVDLKNVPKVNLPKMKTSVIYSEDGNATDPDICDIPTISDDMMCENIKYFVGNVAALPHLDRSLVESFEAFTENKDRTYVMCVEATYVVCARALNLMEDPTFFKDSKLATLYNLAYGCNGIMSYMETGYLENTGQIAQCADIELKNELIDALDKFWYLPKEDANLLAHATELYKKLLTITLEELQTLRGNLLVGKVNFLHFGNYFIARDTAERLVATLKKDFPEIDADVDD